MKKVLRWVCFIAYLLLLIYLLFFADFLGRTGRSAEYRYNLTLFQEIMRYYGIGVRTGSWNLFLWNVIGNIAVFVPLGFFSPMLLKNGRNLLYTMLLSLELSIIVEVLQLVNMVGSFDVDDLLLNTFGGITGYLLYMIFFSLRKSKPKMRK